MPQFAVLAEDHESVQTALHSLLLKPAYRNLLASLILYFLVAYGALIFTVPFMIRIHGLDVAQAGGLIGVLSAVSAVIGNLAGGGIADRLAARDVVWFAWLPGWGMIALLPLYLLAFMAPTITTMALPFFVAGVLLAGAVPPMFSALHIVCGSKRRAMAVAVAFFFANLIGLGLGPVIAGFLSDWFAISYGEVDGLRYAMMAVMVVFVPSGLLMLRAAKHLNNDAED